MREQLLKIRDSLPTAIWEVLCEYGAFLKGPCLEQLIAGKEVKVFEVHVLSFFNFNEIKDKLFNVPHCIISSSYVAVTAKYYNEQTGMAVFHVPDEPEYLPGIGAESRLEKMPTTKQ